MRQWRVVRVQRDMTLYVAEQAYWTKNGAQAAATHLNLTFGNLTSGNVLLGHNFFAVSAGKIPVVEDALARAREKTMK